MIGVLLTAVGCCFGGVGADGSPPPASTYDTLKASTGRDAPAQVQLALWCEAHGLEQERVKHLAIAVLTDPSNAMARGLMGLVEYQGKWKKPETIAESMKSDVAHADLLAEYNGRRVKTAVAVVPQYKLALWCEEKGLHDEARAHLATVVRLDPNHAEAWKLLGYKKVGNRWTTEAQAVAAKSEHDLQQAADKLWKSKLEKLRDSLANRGKRAETERSLAEITDPRAVPMIWRILVEKGDANQLQAVQLLGQIDAIEASRGLATLAVFSKKSEVRRRATETLKRRDPREYADMLITLLRDKVKYEVKSVGGPGSVGVLFIEGKNSNLSRFYSPPPSPNITFLPADTMTRDENGFPVLVHHQYSQNEQLGMWSGPMAPHHDNRAAVSAGLSPLLPQGILADPGSANRLAMFVDPFGERGRDQSAANLGMVTDRTSRGLPDSRTAVRGDALSTAIYKWTDTAIPVGRIMAEAQRAAMSAQQQLQSDVAVLDQWNDVVKKENERIGAVLAAATGESLPAEQKPWRIWYIDQLGLSYKMTSPDQNPTVVENVPLSYVPQAPQIQVNETTTITIRRHSCFAKGTPVQTNIGPRAIEGLSVGDLVLTQNTQRGRLAYRPIVMVHHNPPSPTYKVSFDTSNIVTSPSHRFWKARPGLGDGSRPQSR